MNMPYYIKQRIINQIINVIMVLLLIVTLFPVFWMVYCSFKNNTEILLGKIPFGRAGNDVISITPEKDKLWVFTSDGKIQILNKSDFKPENVASMKTLATNFTTDEKYIWLSSSDKGLIRINKSNLQDYKSFSYPSKEINPNKVVSTKVLKSGNRIWISLYLRDFEKIFEFDCNSQRFYDPIDITSSLSPAEIMSMTQDSDYLYIGTNRGLIKFNKSAKKISAVYFSDDLGVSSVDIRNLTIYESKLYVGTYSGLYELAIPAMELLNKYDISSKLNSDQIETVFVTDKSIIVGTNYGISIIDKRHKNVNNLENIFVAVGDHSKDSQKDLQMATVFTIAKDGNNIYVGSSASRITDLNAASKKVISTFKGKEGHLKIMFKNYVDLWKNINFGLYLRNSILICGITMLIAMVLATFAAYSLSRFHFPGSKFFGIAILATQMIPAIMLLIPIYIMFVKFTELTGIQVKGTFWGLIFVYSAFFIPFSIWILRGFFAAIPIELEEAAKIDGCSPLQVFWHIALPLAVPGIIATGIYVFLTAWDELMFAWVLTNADTITIPVGIRYFVGNYQNRFDLMMAAATISTVPVIILFFLLQKHIVRGLTAGAVKG